MNIILIIGGSYLVYEYLKKKPFANFAKKECEFDLGFERNITNYTNCECKYIPI